MTPVTKILREKQAGPFRIVEKAYGGNATLARHQHQTAFLSFLLGGAYVEASNWGETICSSGTVIWHPQDEAHSDRFHPRGGHLIDLEVEDSWLQDAAQALRPAAQARIFCGGLPYALGLRLYRELSADTSAVENVATELLSFFFTGPSRSHSTGLVSTRVATGQRYRLREPIAYQRCSRGWSAPGASWPAAFVAFWDARSATIWPKSACAGLSNCFLIRSGPS